LTEQDKEGKIEIIGVRFKEAGKIYYFDPNGIEISFGTPVIVETARGLEYGYTAISNRYIPCESIVAPLKKIIRIATKEDKERLDANKALESQASGVFNEKVAKLGLEMTLVGVEYTFDNTKLLFYFAAENRIDFRELVKELAAIFRTRIELRQVGVRDEAKMLGGLGVCGRPLCCKTFLGEFAQVSIKMAKDQSLSLSSSKISGTCGRLLCCLRYEDEVYQQEYERTPKVDAIVETAEGKGVVVETNPLKGIVRVRLDSKKDSPPQAFHRDTVKIIGYLRTNNAVDAELKELEKE
jgi:cell fate regulator YaaT (PSP1 superfamily)